MKVLVMLVILGLGRVSPNGYPMRIPDDGAIASQYAGFSQGSDFLGNGAFLHSNPEFVFDSLNVRFVGNWPFGPSRAVFANGDTVFLGSGVEADITRRILQYQPCLVYYQLKSH